MDTDSVRALKELAFPIIVRNYIDQDSIRNSGLGPDDFSLGTVVAALHIESPLTVEREGMMVIASLLNVLERSSTKLPEFADLFDVVGGCYCRHPNHPLDFLNQVLASPLVAGVKIDLRGDDFLSVAVSVLVKVRWALVRSEDTGYVAMALGAAAGEVGSLESRVLSERKRVGGKNRHRDTDEVKHEMREMFSKWRAGLHTFPGKNGRKEFCNWAEKLHDNRKQIEAWFDDMNRPYKQVKKTP